VQNDTSKCILINNKAAGNEYGNQEEKTKYPGACPGHASVSFPEFGKYFFACLRISDAICGSIEIFGLLLEWLPFIRRRNISSF